MEVTEPDTRRLRQSVDCASLNPHAGRGDTVPGRGDNLRGPDTVERSPSGYQCFVAAIRHHANLARPVLLPKGCFSFQRSPILTRRRSVNVAPPTSKARAPKTKTHNNRRRSGRDARHAFTLFSVIHRCTQECALIATSEIKPSSFLLPDLTLGIGAKSSAIFFRSAREPLPMMENLFAAHLILRFIRRMVDANIADSKLCACDTRHAIETFLSEISAAQLGKGQGFAPPRCIPSRVPQAASETVPVSAPFGLSRVVAFRSWEIRP